MFCWQINSHIIQINLDIICFILPLQISLSVLQYPNYFTAS